MSKISGYENPYLVKLIIQKSLLDRQRILSKEFRPMEFPILAAVGLVSGEKVTVLDFGGGLGGHGLVAKETFSDTLKVNWNIVETKMMIEESTNSNFPKDVNYFPSIEQCLIQNPKIDLIFSNSAIQYTRNPVKTVEELVETNAKFIFFTRTPLAEGDENFSYKQISWLSDNGPGYMTKIKGNKLVEYECSLISKSNFQKHFEQKYEVLFFMREGLWDEQNLKGRAGTYTFAFKLKKPA